MYKPEKKIPEVSVITSTSGIIYIVDGDDDIAEIEKGSFLSRKIIARQHKVVKVFPRPDDLLIYADDKIFIKSDNGTLHQIAEKLDPFATFPKGVLVNERTDDKKALVFIDNSGNRLWEKDIIITNTMLVHNNTLFFSAFDQYMNEEYHLIQRLDIATGVNTVLIDFNGYFGNDPTFRSIEFLEYFFLYSYDNVIVCLINGYKIVGIDAVDGSVKWEIGEMTDREGNKLEGFITGPLEGGVYNNNFYMLRAKSLVCLDTTNKKLTVLRRVEEDLNGDAIFIQRSSIYGNKLLYTAENHVQKKWNLVGVFDIDKEEIIWQTQIDMAAGGFLPVAPFADEKYIYLNDTEKTLHIFKEEG